MKTTSSLWLSAAAAVLVATAALGQSAPDAAPPAGDAAAGKVQFIQRCAMCHAPVPGVAPMGPDLTTVVGAKAASGKFAYSDALKKSGLVWDAVTLDRFLAAPTKLVPGTRMPLGVTDPKQRADIIAYLGSKR